MTVSLIGSPRRTSEEARLDKNRRIRESIKATKAKRKTQTCSTFDLKIVGNKLSHTQREALVRVFLEAKWLWNECIASGDPLSYKPRKNVLVKTKDGMMDEREYRTLGSQMKQSLVKTIRSNIKTLATLKKQGRKVGNVGFTDEVRSLGASATGDHLSHTWTKGENPEYSRLGSCAWRQTIGRLGTGESSSHQ